MTNVIGTHWQEAIAQSANEIAMYALGELETRVEHPIAVTHDVSCSAGAHIPLLGGSQPLELAIVSSPDGCEALARAMLGTDGPLTPAEIADALGELVNMLAGGVKRRLQAHGTELELGLPIFIRGHVEPTDRVSIVALPIDFGPTKTRVLTIGRRL